jgi:Family of unknown function (DUF6152)
MNRLMIRRHVVIAASVVAMAAFFALNQPALAHHGSALWKKGVIVQKGTVTSYLWRNPHVLVTWDAKDDNGKVVEWMGELASPESLMGDDGMTRTSIKPGDKVIMYVRPAKSGTPHSVIVQIRRADCTMLLAWSRQAGGNKTVDENESILRAPCTPWN